MTHTVTHTGKRADGTHGAKSFRPLPFWGKNARKPLCRNGWRAFYHLVRMRSAVRIRPAAPKSPVFYRKQDFFFAFLTDLICGSVCGSKLTHTLGAVCALADVALAVGAFLSYIESTPFLVATTHTTTPRRKLLLFRALEFNSTLLFTGGSSNT